MRMRFFFFRALVASMFVFIPMGTFAAVPRITTTVPLARPYASDNNPLVIGTADAGTTATIYPRARCAGDPRGSGTAATFASPGIRVRIADDEAAFLSVSALDTSTGRVVCSDESFPYAEDSIPPVPPSGILFTPTSPALNTTPLMRGAAESGSAVRVFTTATCAGTPVASGSASTFVAPGLQVTVGENTTTTFYLQDVDSAGNVSSCSAGVTYSTLVATPPPPAPPVAPSPTPLTTPPPPPPASAPSPSPARAERSEPKQKRFPDLLLEDVRLTATQLTWTLRNVGNAPAKGRGLAVQHAWLDNAGRPLGTLRTFLLTGALAPGKGFMFDTDKGKTHARRQIADLFSHPPRSAAALRLVIDPKHRIEESATENNTVVIQRITEDGVQESETVDEEQAPPPAYRAPAQDVPLCTPTPLQPPVPVTPPTPLPSPTPPPLPTTAPPPPPPTPTPPPPPAPPVAPSPTPLTTPPPSPSPTPTSTPTPTSPAPAPAPEPTPIAPSVLPDLVITSLTAAKPVKTATGTYTISMTGIITTVQGKAEASLAVLRVSGKSMATDSNVVVTSSTPYTVKMTWTAPSASAYLVQLCADVGNAIAETNESNNCKSVDVSVQ